MRPRRGGGAGSRDQLRMEWEARDTAPMQSRRRGRRCQREERWKGGEGGGRRGPRVTLSEAKRPGFGHAPFASLRVTPNSLLIALYLSALSALSALSTLSLRL